SARYLVMASEYAGATRLIDMGPASEGQVDSWMGHSSGKWEGDVLVVNVDSLNGNQWLDRAGNYTSENVRIIERFSNIDADHIQYEATITDPTVFTRPWKISLPLYRRIEPNAQLMEFKCVEFAEGLLYGKISKNPPK